MKVTEHRISTNLACITSDAPVADVPCGDCNFCCRILSPYLTPEEVSSGEYPLSIVNGRNGPELVLWRNKEGGCALLVDGKCSIYEKRPLACRQYDCRKGFHKATDEVAKFKFGMSDDDLRENRRLHNLEE